MSSNKKEEIKLSVNLPDFLEDIRNGSFTKDEVELILDKIRERLSEIENERRYDLDMGISDNPKLNREEKVLSRKGKLIEITINVNQKEDE